MILTKETALARAIENVGEPLQVLSHYKNGNHYETMFEDGTRVRQTIDTDETGYTFEFPSNFDLKITNQCPIGCKYCHESSTPDGKHGDILNMPFVDTIQPGTEMAIGGGSALSHPDLIPFLEKVSKLGIFANLTVNQKELQIPSLRNKMSKILDLGIVHGVGVSLTDGTTFNKTVNPIFGNYEYLVVHTIAGVFTEPDIDSVIGRKMLVLGYKDLQGRRAGEFYNNEKAEIEKNMEWMKNHLVLLHNITRLLTFDCLGLKQLDPKTRLGIPDDEWNILFNGDDYDPKMTSTLYVDAVTRTVARASTHPLNDRPKFKDESISELFEMSKKCLL